MKFYRKKSVLVKVLVACILLLALTVYVVPASSQNDEPVFFNVKTYKVHKPSCHWAMQCTKNCIKIKRSEAYKRGGVPCKVCGG